MIIDQTNVFFDSVTMAAGDSQEVGLTSLLMPGREEPIFAFARVVGGDITGLSAITIKLQQAATKGGDYEDVPGSSVTIASAAGTKMGDGVLWRFLPGTVTKPWLKLNVTASGSASGTGKLFAMLSREDPLEYMPGMYIDKNVVLG